MAAFAFPKRTRDPVGQFRLDLDAEFAQDLVGLWLMGAEQSWSSNKLLDHSPYGHHFTFQNFDPTTGWDYDGTRAGVSFDGVDDDATLPNVPRLNVSTFPGITVTGWIKRRVADAYGSIIDKGNGFSAAVSMDMNFGVRNDNRLRFRFGNGSILTGIQPGNTDVPIDEWVFVAGVWGSDLRTYMNGVLDAVVPADFPLADVTNNQPWFLNGNRLYLNGWKDDIRIYRRAFSEREIQRLYEETVDGSYGKILYQPRTSIFIPSVPTALPLFIQKPKEPDESDYAVHWDMLNPRSRGSRKVLDSSPYQHTAEFGVGSSLADWVHDGLYFDGFNVALGPPSNRVLRTNNSWSIECSCTPDYFSGGTISNRPLSFYDPDDLVAVLIAFGNDVLQYFVSGGSIVDISTASVGTKYTLLLTYDGDTVSAYLDGRLARQDSGVLFGRFGSRAVSIGGFHTVSSTFVGTIHNIRAWNRALSPKEVEQLYQAPEQRYYRGFLESASQPVGTGLLARTSRKSERHIRPIELNPDSPFAKGLVGWWPMGNSRSWKSEKLLDASPYENPGALVGMDPATDWVHDGERAELEFDGGKYVRTQPIYDLFNVSYTIIAWLKLDSLKGSGGDRGVYRSGTSNQGLNGMWMSNSTKRMWGRHSGVDVTTLAEGPILDEQQWHLIGIQWDGADAKMLFDGGIWSSVPIGASPDEPIERFGVQNQNSYWGGGIDDFRIYNRALSAAEVKQLYNETKDGSYGSLELRPKRIIFAPSLLPGDVIVNSPLFNAAPLIEGLDPSVSRTKELQL